MSTTHVETRTLPSSLRSALSTIGYHKPSIGVAPAEGYTMAHGSDQGCRAFTMCVDLSSGAVSTHWGSWGGANAFNPGNSVDLDTTVRPIPDGCAIVQGLTGGARPVSASVRVNPSSLAPLLPAVASCTDRERSILAIVRGYKGGAYRRAELDRIGCTPSEIAALASRGLLAVNRAGSVSITVEGKNAAGDRF